MSASKNEYIPFVEYLRGRKPGGFVGRAQDIGVIFLMVGWFCVG